MPKSTKSAPNSAPPATDSLLLAAFDERWGKFHAQYKACRTEFSDDAVHDLRVAARRMLAVLGAARALAPHPRVRKAHRAVKDLIDDMDKLRDTQVMLVEISKTIETLPELKSFQDFLTRRESKLMKAAQKRIKQKGFSDLSKRIKKIRENLEEEEQKDGQFNERLLEAVTKAHSLAGQAYGQVDALQVASIHRLRLTFKKFRYLVEMAHPLIEDFPIANFKKMHDYQSMMGNIQDAEVFLMVISKYAKKHSPPDNLDNVFVFYREKLKSLIAKFLKNKEKIFTFWNFDKPRNEENKNESVHHTSRNRSGSRRPKVPGGQAASADGKGAGQDEENSARAMEAGSAIGHDPVQPGGAGDGNGKDSGE